MVARRLVSFALASALVSSCVLPLQQQGSVTFAWSIGDAADPGSCRARSATAVHVVVRDDIGDLAVDADAPCESFRAKYLLDRGWYEATLVLVDVRGAPVSETQRSNALYVSPRTDTFVEIAFEAATLPR